MILLELFLLTHRLAVFKGGAEASPQSQIKTVAKQAGPRHIFHGPVHYCIVPKGGNSGV